MISIASMGAACVEVEGVEVEVAHLGEAFGGPRAGQGLGELVAPVLVLGPQGPEFGQGRGPPRRPGLRPGRTSRLNGDASGAALAEAALPFSGGEGHLSPIVTPLRNGAPAAPYGPPRPRSDAIAAARGLADLGGRSPDGRGDGPGDHRPPRRPTPRRPGFPTVRGGEDQLVGLVGRVPEGPLAGDGFGRRRAAASGASWTLSVVGAAGSGADSPPSWDSARARRPDPTPGVRPRHAGFARSRDRLVPRG